MANPKSEPGRVEAMWDEYARRVVPANASRVQVEETRRAFYAGGAALFYGLLAMLTDDAEPTTEDMKNMDRLKDEFDAFALGPGAPPS